MMQQCYENVRQYETLCESHISTTIALIKLLTFFMQYITFSNLSLSRTVVIVNSLPERNGNIGTYDTRSKFAWIVKTYLISHFDLSTDHKFPSQKVSWEFSQSWEFSHQRKAEEKPKIDLSRH